MLNKKIIFLRFIILNTCILLTSEYSYASGMVAEVGSQYGCWAFLPFGRRNAVHPLMSSESRSSAYDGVSTEKDTTATPPTVMVSSSGDVNVLSTCTAMSHESRNGLTTAAAPHASLLDRPLQSLTHTISLPGQMALPPLDLSAINGAPRSAWDNRMSASIDEGERPSLRQSAPYSGDSTIDGSQSLPLSPTIQSFNPLCTPANPLERSHGGLRLPPILLAPHNRPDAESGYIPSLLDHNKSSLTRGRAGGHPLCNSRSTSTAEPKSPIYSQSFTRRSRTSSAECTPVSLGALPGTIVPTSPASYHLNKLFSRFGSTTSMLPTVAEELTARSDGGDSAGPTPLNVHGGHISPLDVTDSPSRTSPGKISIRIQKTADFITETYEYYHGFITRYNLVFQDIYKDLDIRQKQNIVDIRNFSIENLKSLAGTSTYQHSIYSFWDQLDEKFTNFKNSQRITDEELWKEIKLHSFKTIVQHIFFSSKFL